MKGTPTQIATMLNREKERDDEEQRDTEINYKIKGDNLLIVALSHSRLRRKVKIETTNSASLLIQKHSKANVILLSLGRKP